MATKTLIASEELEIRLISLAALLQLYAQATCGTQRDHVKRAPKARYLHGLLWGMQIVFHAIRGANGKIELIDGYTRCECLMRGLSSVGPGQNLVLHIHEADTMSRVKAIYDQIDNPTASKKAPDRLDEGLRLTGSLGEFSSPLMSKGPRASAIQLASGGRPTRDAVEMLIDGMRFVDKLGLARTIEATSLLGLYIVIGQYASRFDAAEEFIRIMNRTVYEPQNPSRYHVPVVAFHAMYLKKKHQKSLSCKGNLDAVFQSGLAAFVRFLGRDNMVPTLVAVGEQMSLGTFIEVVAATK